MSAPEPLRYLGSGVAAGFLGLYAWDSYQRFTGAYQAAAEGEIHREGKPTSWEYVGAMLGEKRKD
ncbi:MAG: hypothetical protein ABEJ75_03325 [Candidatus Nanohaloarchaea archaeon]